MNTLYYGDNLKILRDYIKDESVDLVYLDPPFHSNCNYNVWFRNESGAEAESQITAFEDTWHWNIHAEETYSELINQPDQVGRMIESFRAFIGNNQMMAYLVMMAVAVVSSCAGGPRSVTTNQPETSATNVVTPAAEPARRISLEDQARVLVGLDDKQTVAANVNDIRVKRVRYLLEELVNRTGEDLVTIAAQTDSTSTFIENKYGRQITRQKLLEDMKAFYSDPKLKLKPSYKEAITLQTLLDYAK